MVLLRFAVRGGSRRLFAFALSVLMVATGVFGPGLTPVASAASPAQRPNAAGENPTSNPSSPLGSHVAAAPIYPHDPSGATLPNDPSITRRPAFARYSPPKTRTELPDARTEHSRTFANPDGSFTQEASEGRLNYLDRSGNWQPMNLALTPTSAGPYGLQVPANDVSVLFGTSSAQTALASLSDGSRTIKIRALGYGAGAYDAKANRVEFASATQGATLTAQPTDAGFEFGAIIPDASVSGVFSFALDSGGLTAALDPDGRTVLLQGTDATGQTVLEGAISAPSLLDGHGVPADPAAISVSLIAPTAPGAPNGLGPTEVLLQYTIDPTWLHDPARGFPITLDPNACIGQGASGCTINVTSGNFDHFIMSALPDSYPTGWTTIRAGYDVRTDDGNVYGAMRGLLYFSPATLPDGAEISSATTKLHIDSEYGSPTTETMWLFQMTSTWSQTSTWNQRNGSRTTANGANLAIPASGDMTWTTTAMVRSWYTKRPADWAVNDGFMVEMNHENSTAGEVEFRRYSDSTLSYRPLLTINYVLPKVQFSFDPDLGNTYAPSVMVAGQTTKLPIIVTNNGSGFTFNHTSGSDYYQAGYRWLDAKGNLVGSGTTPLPADVTSGSSSQRFVLPVAAPSAGVGQYTLRLDLVHSVGGTVWASDWATPSLYYSRTKNILTSDNTRWTGSSVIERDDFPIDVVAGGGSNIGETRSVKTGEGGTLGVDLATQNLSYANSTDLGFADLEPLGLDYGYNSADASSCSAYQGILGACGWYTNFDERLTGGANPGAFTYQAPDGNRYLVDTDSDGQLISGAPILLSRTRATLFDENAPSSGPSFVKAAPEGIPGYSGQYVLKAPANASTGNIGGASMNGNISLNTYQIARFGVRSTSAASAGIDFYIYNRTKSSYRWFSYTVGPSWTTGYSQVNLGGTIAGTWTAYSDNLWSRISSDTNFGASSDDYYINQVSIQSSSSSNTGSVYVDAWRLEPMGSNSISDANPAWTTGGTGTTTTSDAAVGTASVKVPTATLGNSPDCLNTGCFGANAGATSYPFAHWWWKKLGGTDIAVVFHLKDTRSGTTGDLTYYAGPTPPPGAANPIQVTPTLPGAWSREIRNVVEDARQVLGFFNDAGNGSPDPVQMTGYKAWAVDGNFGLYDDLGFTTVPDYAATDRWGHPDEYAHPSGAGDSTFTYDFKAEYSDGATHFFNRDGLLTRIADRDGNAISLDWTYGSGTGQASFTLATIHAPSDGATNGGTTYRRQITLTVSTSSPLNTFTFAENLGTTSASTSSRKSAFYVASAADPGGTYGIGDLVKVSPARHSPSTSCGSHPSGCEELTYTDTTNHRLFQLADPRWDGSSSGSGDDRFEVTWSGSPAAPVALLDRSHSATALLTILSWDHNTDATPLYRRPLYQDAAAGAKGYAIHAQLTPEGRETVRYAPPRPAPAATASPIRRPAIRRRSARSRPIRAPSTG